MTCHLGQVATQPGNGDVDDEIVSTAQHGIGKAARDAHRQLHHLEVPRHLDARALLLAAKPDALCCALQITVHERVDLFRRAAPHGSTSIRMRYGNGGETTPCITEPLCNKRPSTVKSRSHGHHAS